MYIYKTRRNCYKSISFLQYFMGVLSQGICILILRTFINERPGNSVDSATSRFPTPTNFFICGEADRSGRGKRSSSSCCCCCCWGPFFSLPCTVFWGVKRQKSYLKRGVKRQKLYQKGHEKAKTLSQKGCEKAKTLSQKGCEKAKTLSQKGREKAKTLSKTVYIIL